VIKRKTTQGIDRFCEFSPFLDRKGRRLYFRLMDKFHLPNDHIDRCMRNTFPNTFPEVYWRNFNKMTVFSFIQAYLKYEHGLHMTDELLREQLLTWDLSEKSGFHYATKAKISKEVYAPEMPMNETEAKNVAYDDYFRGRDVGRSMYKAARYLIAMAALLNQKLVVYGRDGQIIYDALCFLKKLLNSPVEVAYIIVSRNQLSLLERTNGEASFFHKKKINVIYTCDDNEQRSVEVSLEQYRNYMKAVTTAVSSPDVIHVDTGYTGSVPTRLHKFLVKTGRREFTKAPTIRMLRSSKIDCQIPGVDVDDVISRIEHKEQSFRRTYTLNEPKLNPLSYKYNAFRIGVFARMREEHQKASDCISPTEKPLFQASTDYNVPPVEEFIK
jgi:hypothetical protein